MSTDRQHKYKTQKEIVERDLKDCDHRDTYLKPGDSFWYKEKEINKTKFEFHQVEIVQISETVPYATKPKLFVFIDNDTDILKLY